MDVERTFSQRAHLLMRASRNVLGATAMAVLAGGAIVASTATTVQGQGAAASRQVTFTKDVAPIMQAKCQTCHRPGAIAPFSLLTYEDARPWASAIKRQV